VSKHVEAAAEWGRADQPVLVSLTFHNSRWRVVGGILYVEDR
jgi:hypothetical protein